ncbi:MAG: glucan biosynthesis protein G [Rhodobacteraceae bacterium]|uniref:glucan biosynthesis protein n=1 Tax=Amaricoccus sp. B4 TaxID=3368557 RepID=UPI0013A6F9F6|nr:glucan biosynthesis protein G [Paracoccaceae bacterium]
MNRRSFVTSMLALLGGAGPALLGGQILGMRPANAETVDPRPGPALSEEATPFSLEGLQEMARKLSEQGFSERPEIPAAWREMSYDQYRAIWFNSNRALWQGTEKPVRVDFFAPGAYYTRPVEINIVSGAESRTVLFDYDLFKKGEQAPELPIDDTLGYSGFRLRGAVAGPGEYKEFLVFQGASYFRAIARGENYGLSARGLGIRTADERGEEFPAFTKFWIVEPKAGDTVTTIHALLDSPSTTGIYTFEAEPGDATTINVRATLYPRTDMDHVGIAPLTSMFLFDETNRNRFDDFRPAVHDSDGLLVWNGAGEVLWRPLANPKTLQVSDFMDHNPKGFGLMQRSRKFSDFADLEALYHTRPSLWIEPGADWGDGAVALVEIPADKEIYDNIVAYWRPKDVIPAGKPYEFSYRMFWDGEPILGRDVARVINTRLGRNHHGEGYTVTVDFAAHDLLPANPRDVQVSLSDNRGTVKDGIIQRNPETGGLRLAFHFVPGDASSIEMRAQLSKDGQVISETWLYRWTA